MFNIFGKKSLSPEKFSKKIIESIEKFCDQNKPSQITDNQELLDSIQKAEETTSGDLCVYKEGVMLFSFWVVKSQFAEDINSFEKSVLMVHLHRKCLDMVGIDNSRLDITTEYNEVDVPSKYKSEEAQAKMFNVMTIYDFYTEAFNKGKKTQKEGGLGVQLGEEIAKNIFKYKSVDKLRFSELMKLIILFKEILNELDGSVFKKYKLNI